MMELMNLVYMLPTVVFGVLAFKVFKGQRDLEIDIAERRFAGLQDMTAAWRASRTEAPVNETAPSRAKAKPEAKTIAGRSRVSADAVLGRKHPGVAAAPVMAASQAKKA